jgi:hypothetical protein
MIGLSSRGTNAGGFFIADTKEYIAILIFNILNTRNVSEFILCF